MPVSRVRQTRLQELSRKARWNTIRKRAAIITGTMTEKAMTVDIIMEKDLIVDIRRGMKAVAAITEKTMRVGIIMAKGMVAGIKRVTRAAAAITASEQP